MKVARQIGIRTAIVCSLDTCPIAAWPSQSRLWISDLFFIEHLCGSLKNHTLFGLSCQWADGTCQDPSLSQQKSKQQQPLHTAQSTPVFPHAAFIPTAAHLLKSPLFTSFPLFIIFLYFVEKFLEPQDPGDLCGNNKFRKGLHIPPSNSTPTACSGIPRQQSLLPVTCRWTLGRAPARPRRIPARNISHSSYPLLFCGFGSAEENWNGVCSGQWAESFFCMCEFLLLL